MGKACSIRLVLLHLANEPCLYLDRSLFSESPTVWCSDECSHWDLSWKDLFQSENNICQMNHKTYLKLITDNYYVYKMTMRLAPLWDRVVFILHACPAACVLEISKTWLSHLPNWDWDNEPVPSSSLCVMHCKQAIMLWGHLFGGKHVIFFHTNSRDF